MVINYDKTKGFSSFFDIFKKNIANVPSEANGVFERISQVMTPTAISQGKIDWDGFIKKMELLLNHYKIFLKIQIIQLKR